VLLENVRITADLPFGIFSAERVQLKHSAITTREGVNQLATAHAQVTVAP